MGLQRNVLQTLHSASHSTGNPATFWSADTVPAQANLFGRGRKEEFYREACFDLHLLAVSVIALGFLLQTAAKSARASWLRETYQKQEKLLSQSPLGRVISPMGHNIAKRTTCKLLTILKIQMRGFAVDDFCALK